jgi:hypothetical protein
MAKAKRSVLLIAGLAAGILCLWFAPASDHVVMQEAAAPADWPKQLDGRTLHACEYGLVYAREQSSADQLREVLGTVVQDANQDGVTSCGVGLILVVDTGEKYPCETAKLVDQLMKNDPNLTKEESDKNLKAFADAQKQAEDVGLELSVMLSLVPIPIRPEAVHAIVEGLPADVGQRVQWCVICPTDRCLKASFSQTIDAGLKKAKIGRAERATIAVMRPLAERKGVEMMKKERQAGLYSVLLGAQKGLSAEQTRQKIAAYRDKLGLVNKPDPNKDPNSPPQSQPDGVEPNQADPN